MLLTHQLPDSYQKQGGILQTGIPDCGLGQFPFRYLYGRIPGTVHRLSDVCAGNHHHACRCKPNLYLYQIPESDPDCMVHVCILAGCAGHGSAYSAQTDGNRFPALPDFGLYLHLLRNSRTDQRSTDQESAEGIQQTAETVIIQQL